MPPYTVTLSGRAEGDLKRLPPPVQDALCHVITHELQVRPRDGDADEGLVDGPLEIGSRHERLLWRRGVTRRSRGMLEAGLDLPGNITEACEYVIVYALLEPGILDGPGLRFKVATIVSNGHLAAPARRLRTLGRRSSRVARPGSGA